MSIHSAERRHLAPPEPDPVLDGTISRTLLEGAHEEMECEIEFDTRDGLTIYAAIIGGEEIDPAEITPRDREAFRSLIWENWEEER